MLSLKIKKYLHGRTLATQPLPDYILLLRASSDKYNEVKINYNLRKIIMNCLYLDFSAKIN